MDLERQGCRLRARRARPGDEARFCAIELDVFDGVVTQPAVGEEDDVAMLVAGDLHVLPGDEQLLRHGLAKFITVGKPPVLGADDLCDGDMLAVLLLFRHPGRAGQRTGDNSTGAAVWVAFWEVAGGWHVTGRAKRGEVGGGSGERWSWRWGWLGVLVGVRWGCSAVACVVAGVEAEEAAGWITASSQKVVGGEALEASALHTLFEEVRNGAAKASKDRRPLLGDGPKTGGVAVSLFFFFLRWTSCQPWLAQPRLLSWSAS